MTPSRLESFLQSFFDIPQHLHSQAMPWSSRADRFRYRPSVFRTCEDHKAVRSSSTLDIVTEGVDQLIVGRIENRRSQIRCEIVLTRLRTNLARDDRAPFLNFLAFVLFQQLLKVEDRSVQFRGLQWRDQVIDDDRKSSPLRLQTFADTIDGVEITAGIESTIMSG